MKKTAVVILSLALFGIGFAPPSLAETESRPSFALDPATGNIDGRVAVVLYPAIYRNGKMAEVLPPNGFRALLVSADDPSKELSFDCGTWFQPPPGRYRVSVTGPGLISPYTTMLLYAGNEFVDKGMAAVVPVVEAGTVALAPELGEAPNTELRLLHAGSYLEAGFARRELSRRRSIDQIGEGVEMPAGPTLAALWDRNAERYTALGPPFEVAAGKKTLAPLDTPKGVSAAIIQLQRAKKASRQADYDVELSITVDGVRYEPDVKVPTSKILYAVWYALPAGRGELRAGSERLLLKPEELDLELDRITRFVGRLDKRGEFVTEPDWMHRGR